MQFASVTIHGAVDFGSSDIRSIPNLTTSGPVTMNGAILRDVSGWSVSTPITGNGFVHGPIPTGLNFTAQGSAPANYSFVPAPGDVLIVSQTPYLIENPNFTFRGKFSRDEWAHGAGSVPLLR
jgi:hypothetical protein